MSETTTTEAAPAEKEGSETRVGAMHQAFADYIKREKGIDITAEQVFAVTSTRVAFRKSDDYLVGVREARAKEKEEAEAAKAAAKEQREAERKAAAEKKAQEKAEADAKKAAEKAEADKKAAAAKDSGEALAQANEAAAEKKTGKGKAAPADGAKAKTASPF